MGGADAAKFTINATTGVLEFVSAPDAEVPTDAGGNNVYDVQVQVSDGTNTDVQDIAVTVTGVNDNTPVITSNGGAATAAVNVAENTTAVTTVTATDADAGATLTYSIVGGADAARFSIDASTGVLSFVSGAGLRSSDRRRREQRLRRSVQVSDGATDTQDIAVTVTRVNDNTPVITSNGAARRRSRQGGGERYHGHDRHGHRRRCRRRRSHTRSWGVPTPRGSASTPRPGCWSSSRRRTSKLRPTPAATTSTTCRCRSPTAPIPTPRTSPSPITNVNDNSPVITSNGGGATAAVKVAENTTAVTTVTATDADAGATLTYTIVGGADAARFTINASTGVLEFVSAPDFETPTDAGGNNVYDVHGAGVGRHQHRHPGHRRDGDQRQRQYACYHIERRRRHGRCQRGGEQHHGHHGHGDRRRCRRDADLLRSWAAPTPPSSPSTPATGVLEFVSAPDFEGPTDAGGNNVYDVQVQVSDGTNTDVQDIAVTVTNVNDNTPVITSNGGGATAAVNVAENSTAVTTVTAIDADAGATLTYTIVGGADAAKFTINASDRRCCTFVSAPDFETPTDAGGNNVYDVTSAGVGRDQHRQPGHRGHRHQRIRFIYWNVWRRHDHGIIRGRYDRRPRRQRYAHRRGRRRHHRPAAWGPTRS